MKMPLQLRLLPKLFCIHKLEADAEIPTSLLKEKFVWIGRTEDELSIICQSTEIESQSHEKDWVCLQVLDILDFDAFGVIASFSATLAENKIPVLCVSTFNTDYAFVKDKNRTKALEVLQAAGHKIST